MNRQEPPHKQHVGRNRMAVYTRRLVAELVGTFVLVTFGGFAIFAANFGNATADGAPIP